MNERIKDRKHCGRNCKLPASSFHNVFRGYFPQGHYILKLSCKGRWWWMGKSAKSSDPYRPRQYTSFNPV